MAYRFHEQMKDKRWNIDENPAILCGVWIKDI